MTRNPISVENGKRLRALRDVRTRVGVARTVGISYSALAFYENGDREPSGSVKQRLAAYYGVPVEQIFLPTRTAKTSIDQKE